MKEIIVNNYPKSSLTESMRSIKVNLRFSSINKKIKKILITSSLENEGKSFISSNLATVFASPTEKVLLIDCDLRKGRINDLFDIKNKSLGLSDLLIDEQWENNINQYIKSTEIENLDVLISGTFPPNPTALLESQKLENILNNLSEFYDIIILDAPPVTGLSDSLILTRLVDTVIVVTRARKTTMDQLETTINALKNVNANVAGVILNKIKKQDDKYYSKYQ